MVHFTSRCGVGIHTARTKTVSCPVRKEVIVTASCVGKLLKEDDSDILGKASRRWLLRQVDGPFP
jgi:hypothetical protein